MENIDLISADEYQTSERFYALPKILFESDLYKEMRLDAKVFYAVLKDRLSLSFKNNWIDEDGYVFLVYSNSKLMDILNCSKSTLLRMKKELTQFGLIYEVQQSTPKTGNLANRIYLGQLKDNFLTQNNKKVEDSHVESRVVSNLYQGDVKFIPGGCQNNTRLVSKSAPNDTEDNETYLSEYTSSRKSSKNSKEFPSSTRADNISSIEKSEKYIDPQYYSLLQVIADEHNGKFCQQDLFTGEFQNYSLTHKQKMMIGQYLSDGYITSREIINVIERICYDSESPLAYLLKSLENLKEERRLEAKILAHRKAEMAFSE